MTCQSCGATVTIASGHIAGGRTCVLRSSARKLAQSISAITAQLESELAAGRSMANALCWTKAELERLAEESEAIAEEAFDLERRAVAS